MSTDDRVSEVEPARRRRWIWAIGLMALLVLLGAMLTPPIAFRIRHAAELRKVQEEVARIQAAGEPITIEDRYAHFRLPSGSRDITPLWQTAFEAVDERAFREESGDLPIVGNPQLDVMPPHQLVPAEQFLAKYDTAIQRALVAARSRGECRFPVNLNELEYDLPHADKLWPIQKLLMLRGRVAVAHGETEKAIESIEAQLAVSRSLAHQLSETEYLISLSMARKALGEIDFLINEFDLSDAQLCRLQQDVFSEDLIQPGLNWALHGERGAGYFAFHHLEQVQHHEEDGGTPMSKLPDKLAAIGTGTLNRPKECLVFLKYMEEFIDAGREPFPRPLDRGEQIRSRFDVLVKSSGSGETIGVEITLGAFAGCMYAFRDAAHTLALRDLIACALAARRYELKHGKRPAILTDLVPEFLNQLPSDPFDGQPLRMLVTSDDLLLYSIGKDRRDDGGIESEERGEPSDIVVRLRTVKE